MNHAERLLNDPDLTKALEDIDQQIWAVVKRTQLDGSEDSKDYLLELVRKGQTLESIKALLWQQLNYGKLTESQLERKTKPTIN